MKPMRKLLLNSYSGPEIKSFHAIYSCNESDVAEIAVSYDGTWSKRGYTANFGVDFIISVETGEVLDYDFESKLCMEYATAKKDLGEDSSEFDMWFRGQMLCLTCGSVVKC
jgi:hypothetical protein